MSKVRSAKGEMVDFDYFKIKNQIAAAPKSVAVAARESFIDNKLKRRLKRAKAEVATQSPNINDVQTVEQEQEK